MKKIKEFYDGHEMSICLAGLNLIHIFFQTQVGTVGSVILSAIMAISTVALYFVLECESKELLDFNIELCKSNDELADANQQIIDVVENNIKGE